ncbi:MAG: SAM-dependent methyltransferase, partial [Dehalococcoidia bacterium]
MSYINWYHGFDKSIEVKMAKQSVSNTALGAAICRLIEQYEPEETLLFSDPIVKDLVGAPIRLLMRSARMRNFTVRQTDAAATGIYGAQICRTRFIDDVIQPALLEGIGQVVILGAGFDTRPYRLPGMERVIVFEVDLPAVQNNKKNRLKKHYGHLPKNVIFIPIDFDTQSLETILTSSAFDPS